MHAHTAASQPHALLGPATRVLLLVPVALFLAGVVSIATSASHQALDRMSALLQPAVQDAAPLRIAARHAPPGCPATRPEAS